MKLQVKKKLKEIKIQFPLYIFQPTMVGKLVNYDCFTHSCNSKNTAVLLGILFHCPKTIKNAAAQHLTRARYTDSAGRREMGGDTVKLLPTFQVPNKGCFFCINSLRTRLWLLLGKGEYQLSSGHIHCRVHASLGERFPYTLDHLFTNSLIEQTLLGGT